jgi:hypothetical protein
LAALFAFGPAPVLGQNIITNGGFENGFFDGVGGVMSLPNNSFDIDGWQVLGGVSGGIQWLTAANLYGFMPADGMRFLNLVGTSAGADNAGIQLGLPLAVLPGHEYQLTFDLGTTAADHWIYTDPTGLPGPGVQVSISGSSAGSQVFYFFGDTSQPNNAGNNRWTVETTGYFEATGYWLSISFSSIGYGGESFVGLDGVSVVPLPEPSSAGLWSCGLLAFWGRAWRARRNVPSPLSR